MLQNNEAVGGNYLSGRGHYPSGRGHYPSGRGHYPSGRGHYPSGRGHYPSGRGHYPSGRGHSRPRKRRGVGVTDPTVTAPPWWREMFGHSIIHAFAREVSLNSKRAIELSIKATGKTYNPATSDWRQYEALAIIPLQTCCVGQKELAPDPPHGISATPDMLCRTNRARARPTTWHSCHSRHVVSDKQSSRPTQHMALVPLQTCCVGQTELAPDPPQQFTHTCSMLQKNGKLREGYWSM